MGSYNLDEEEDEGDIVIKYDGYVRTRAFWIAPAERVEDNWCCSMGPFKGLSKKNLDQEEWFAIM